MTFRSWLDALRHFSPQRIRRSVAELRWDIAKTHTVGLQQLAQLNAHFVTNLMAADGRYTHPLSLARHHCQVYSQHGEDGIVAEIFRRLGLPLEPFFVEIGIENGQECNTRFLVEQGWRGVWIEGNRTAAQEARNTFSQFIAAGSLRIINSMVTIENINRLLDEAQVPDEIAYLSLDIDQNTSHVWRAIRRRSRVACVEYNATLPPSLDLEVPYDAAAVWDESNWYGASLKTLENIAAAKGLSLVGCELSGTNAFFVCSDSAHGKFREPFTAETHYEPPNFDLIGPHGHPPSRHARRWSTLAHRSPDAKQAMCGEEDRDSGC